MKTASLARQALGTVNAQVHRKKLNQRLALPKSVKDVLQQPQDETDWAKVEQLRVALLSVLQGEEDVALTEEEAEKLAAAIRGNHEAERPDEVGEGSDKLPAGSRVCVSVPVQTHKKHIARCRQKIADIVVHQSVVRAFLRPLESKNERRCSMHLEGPWWQASRRRRSWRGSGT